MPPPRDTYTTPLPGVRAYRYTVDGNERVAIHWHPGASSLDLTLQEAQDLALDLTNLVG